VITGRELAMLDDAALGARVLETRVYARVAPAQKIRVVEALQAHGQFVAMTGDGVNDAPALKRADIGVAMGRGGTDVAREASDMVLLDDNFATIVAAVRGGRRIFDNIRRFIKYLLSCNASEIAVMLIGPFLGMPLPLLPLQILWMNLVTDGMPALALGVEPAEENVMQRPPYSSQESIFGRGMLPFIGVMGVLMSIISLAVGYFSYTSGSPDWQALLFSTLIFSQLMLALEVRSETNSLFRIGLFSNPSMVWAMLVTLALQFAVIYLPFFQNIFSTRPLTLPELGITFGAGMLVLIAAEIWKFFLRRRQ
jgi:Ca2+-transporting ATPase